MPTVVIAGATGLVGSSALDRFVERGWDVVTISRRAPATAGRGPFRSIRVDLRDAEATRDALAGLGATHLVYTAVYETPELVQGWTQARQQRVNRDMFRHALAGVLAGGRLAHVGLLQGAKAYGTHLHPIRIPSREHEPRDPHENFYWLQEDDLRGAADRDGFDWTILRPQLVIGAATGVAMNPLLAIAMYVAIRAARGESAGFPGGPTDVWELADPRIIAEALEWAATAPAAQRRTFNVTNGDVFEWRDLWPEIVAAIGGVAGADDPTSMQQYILDHRDDWGELVRRHGLQEVPIEELLAQSGTYADHCVRHGRETPSYPRLLSTIAIRQAGFTGCVDSVESVRHWIGRLREDRVLPPVA